MAKHTREVDDRIVIAVTYLVDTSNLFSSAEAYVEEEDLDKYASETNYLEKVYALVAHLYPEAEVGVTAAKPGQQSNILVQFDDGTMEVFPGSGDIDEAWNVNEAAAAVYQDSDWYVFKDEQP